ncbi:hypothetical protein BHE74_00014866 [Ensete ventricosum]|nr:hypothetical protein BHE74_00014866 [Ensete ventricosum]
MAVVNRKEVAKGKQGTNEQGRGKGRGKMLYGGCSEWGKQQSAAVNTEGEEEAVEGRGRKEEEKERCDGSRAETK